MKMTNRVRATLLSLIRKFSGCRVVVVGDMVADEFVYGEISRVSREAPVLILRERERKVLPGGGGNAVNNLADLGAQAVPVGVVGDDDAGEELLRYFEAKKVPTRGILRVRGYTTPTKSRILGGVTHWQRQQIVRVDREPAPDGRQSVRESIRKLASQRLSRAQAVLVSDYGYGTTNAAEVERMRKGRCVPVVVDSRFDLASYAQVTALTPNEPEVEAAFGKSIGNDADLLFELGRTMLLRQALQALLITRGRDGMVLFEAGRKPQLIPVFGSDQAVDVTGAGDTVGAVFTLALAAGAGFADAALLANCAGGIVVMKRGTATVTARELKEVIQNS